MLGTLFFPIPVLNCDFKCLKEFLVFTGNVVALLHSFFSNLPQEWLEGTHVVIKQLRPVTSVAMLRIAFRIMGPLLPRLANAHALFNKVYKITNSTIIRKLSLYVCTFFYTLSVLLVPACVQYFDLEINPWMCIIPQSRILTNSFCR